jgi:uncharacterized membrane protein SpoIIM required for sporulation
MNLERFEAQRGPDWVRLEALLGRGAGRRGRRRLGAGGVLELAALYRGAAADLAYARRRFPGDPVVGRLEALVLRGRVAVYGRTGRRGSLRAFFARGYWRRLAERPGMVALAWALLLLPAAAGVAWGLADPGAAVGLVPAEFSGAADPPAEGRDFGAGEGSVFATQVLINNIQVTLAAFVGGLLFGAGTVFALAYNGLLIGTIAGLAFGAGNGEAFIRLISSHGPLELSCIVVGGVAGLRLGHAMLVPGSRTRLRSLQHEARQSVELAVGTAPWLVLCGFLEGLATGPELPLAVQVALGLGLAALFWGLVVWRGRGQSSARDFARR